MPGRMIAVLAVLAAGWLAMSYWGAFEEPSLPAQTQFAADRLPQEVKVPPFDGKRAMKYLEAVCAIGPRMSATPGMKKQQELLREHFTKFDGEVKSQVFQAKQVTQKNAVEMTNLVISFPPRRDRRVIICCHYDTRPIADQEPDPRKWREPFVSANDGGSGVAFLMELAHHMKELKLQVGLDFVIFDGEEYIFNKDRDKYFFGSEHFAKTWLNNKKDPQYLAAVLLDMIAGKDAKFPAEGYSWAQHPELVREIWEIGRELRLNVFQQRIGGRVLDDHLALQEAGIPAIDIIDFDYPHWHKLSDTPANCAPEPMEQVAKVLCTWMQRLK
ncbi:MAG: M28 family peptidase [Gemmataceae bacterium]|nr:M28 family peptidase [Gemmataceae bacterium]MCI0737677.1 M28 family peptidase [Gemmataceae bacterium]